MSANLADLPAGAAEAGADVTLDGGELEETAGAAVDRREQTASGDDVRSAKVATLLSDLPAYLSNLANLANSADLSYLAAGLAANLTDLPTDLAYLSTSLSGLSRLPTDLPNLAAALPKLAAEVPCHPAAPSRPPPETPLRSGLAS